MLERAASDADAIFPVFIFYYTATNISNNTVLTNNARKLPLVCDWTGLAWRQRHGFNDLLIFLSAPRLYYHLVNLRVFCFYP